MKFVKETVLEWKPQCSGSTYLMNGLKVVCCIEDCVGGFSCYSGNKILNDCGVFSDEAAAVAWVESKLPEVFGRRVE